MTGCVKPYSKLQAYAVAPRASSAMSVILPYIVPLLLLLETNTEAKVDIAGARGVGRGVGRGGFKKGN